MSFDLDLGVAKNFCRNHTPHKISSERNDLTFGPKKNCWQVGFSDRARLVISFSQMSSYEMNRLKSRNSSTYQLVMDIWSPETKLKCWKCTGNFDKISFFSHTGRDCGRGQRISTVFDWWCIETMSSRIPWWLTFSDFSSRNRKYN